LVACASRPFQQHALIDTSTIRPQRAKYFLNSPPFNQAIMHSCTHALASRLTMRRWPRITAGPLVSHGCGSFVHWPCDFRPETATFFLTFTSTMFCSPQVSAVCLFSLGARVAKTAVWEMQSSVRAPAHAQKTLCPQSSVLTSRPSPTRFFFLLFRHAQALRT
jgi:hypothetical protein